MEFRNADGVLLTVSHQGDVLQLDFYLSGAETPNSTIKLRGQESNSIIAWLKHGALK